jgi:hypothetical protein
LTFSSHHSSFPSFGFCLALKLAKQVNQTLLIINAFPGRRTQKSDVEKIKVIEFFMNSEGAMKQCDEIRKGKSGKVNYKNYLFISVVKAMLKQRKLFN